MGTVVKNIPLFDLSATTGAGFATAFLVPVGRHGEPFQLQNAASIAAMGGGMPDMGGMM
jgi:hypothetical protein